MGAQVAVELTGMGLLDHQNAVDARQRGFEAVGLDRQDKPECDQPDAVEPGQGLARGAGRRSPGDDGEASLAIDVGQFYAEQAELQVAADAAALAALGDLPNEGQARQTARDYIEKHFPELKHGQVVQDSDIAAGNWDSNTRTFTAGLDPINALQGPGDHTTRRSCCSRRRSMQSGLRCQNLVRQ